jgi:hypothetical protein
MTINAKKILRSSIKLVIGTIPDSGETTDSFVNKVCEAVKASLADSDASDMYGSVIPEKDATARAKIFTEVSFQNEMAEEEGKEVLCTITRGRSPMIFKGKHVGTAVKAAGADFAYNDADKLAPLVVGRRTDSITRLVWEASQKKSADSVLASVSEAAYRATVALNALDMSSEAKKQLTEALIAGFKSADAWTETEDFSAAVETFRKEPVKRGRKAGSKSQPPGAVEALEDGSHDEEGEEGEEGEEAGADESDEEAPLRIEPGKLAPPVKELVLVTEEGETLHQTSANKRGKGKGKKLERPTFLS